MGHKRFFSHKVLVIGLVLIVALLLILVSRPAAARGDLSVYPGQAQGDEQLRQDRFECRRWAARETLRSDCLPRAAVVHRRNPGA